MPMSAPRRCTRDPWSSRSAARQPSGTRGAPRPGTGADTPIGLMVAGCCAGQARGVTVSPSSTTKFASTDASMAITDRHARQPDPVVGVSQQVIWTVDSSRIPLQVRAEGEDGQGERGEDGEQRPDEPEVAAVGHTSDG